MNKIIHTDAFHNSSNNFNILKSITIKKLKK